MNTDITNGLGPAEQPKPKPVPTNKPFGRVKPDVASDLSKLHLYSN